LSETSAEKETGRVEAFSDGVYAIAITLLVLELKVPHVATQAELARALVAQWPSYAALVTSFATIGIMWINHHTLFGLIRRVDHGLLIWNALLLLGTTVVPFPTALVAATLGHPGASLAAAVYSGVYLVIALLFTGLWRHASSPRRQPPLLRHPPDHPAVQAVHARYRFGPLFYLASLAVAPVSAGGSLALNLAFAIFWAVPYRAGR